MSVDERFQLLLAGDAMLGRGVNAVIQRAGPAYPLGPLTKITRRAGLFFANLECALSSEEHLYSGPPKPFYFCADPIAAKTLRHAGVDLVSLANNHALDADFSGLLDTLAILDQEGIAHSGAGEDLKAAASPALIEFENQRLGVLACCDHQADFAAGEARPGIYYVDLSDPRMLASLAGQVEVLAAQVDHVVVAFHWQPNWAAHISPFYRRLADLLVEAGARVIWGHSPHHFQGVEWKGKSIVLFSTGGLVDDYALEPVFRNDRQLLFQLELSNQGVERARAFPIELEFAHSLPAGQPAWNWIQARFSAMCAEVGSRVEKRGRWLEITSAEGAAQE